MARKNASPLRNFRRARTLSQDDMARLLSISQQTYSKYESGLIDPPADTKARIAAIFGESTDAVFPREAVAS